MSPPPSPIPPRDQWPNELKALWDLYDVTDGPSWHGVALWTENNSPCGVCPGCDPWTGIICPDGTGDNVDVRQINLVGHGLRLPPGGDLPRNIFMMCVDPQSGVECAGFPPESCKVFGPEARLNADPRRYGNCLDCNAGTLAVSILAVIGGFVAMVMYIFRLNKVSARDEYQGWVASVSILFDTLVDTAVTSSLLVVEFSAPNFRRVIAHFQTVFFSLDGLHLECLLPPGQSGLPYLVSFFFLMPVMIVGALAFLPKAVFFPEGHEMGSRIGLSVETRHKTAVTVFSQFFPSMMALGIRWCALGVEPFSVLGGLLVTFQTIGLLLVLALAVEDAKGRTEKDSTSMDEKNGGLDKTDKLQYLKYRFRDFSEEKELWDKPDRTTYEEAKKYIVYLRYWPFVDWLLFILLLIGEGGLSSDPHAQSGWAIAMWFLYVLLLSIARPYADVSDDKLEDVPPRLRTCAKISKNANAIASGMYQLLIVILTRIIESENNGETPETAEELASAYDSTAATVTLTLLFFMLLVPILSGLAMDCKTSVKKLIVLCSSCKVRVATAPATAKKTLERIKSGEALTDAKEASGKAARSARAAASRMSKRVGDVWTGRPSAIIKDVDATAEVLADANARSVRM